MPGAAKALGGIVRDGVKAIVRTGSISIGITVGRCVSGVIAAGTKGNIDSRVAQTAVA